MAAGHTIAIGLGRHTLSAISVERDGRAICVERVLSVDVPDSTDPAVLGKWLADQLERADFPSGAVTLALPRDQLGIKRLTLPTTDPTELPQMTRLAMLRDLPFDATGAVIDFIPLNEDEDSTTVLAVAAPQSVLDFARAVTKAAGLGLQRVSMRAMGTACLARTLNGATEGHSSLVIDVTGPNVEFCVLANGAVRFVRAAEFTNGEAAGPSAQAVVTETRRTWMSYRMSEGAEDVDEVLLLGDADLMADAASEIGSLLKVPARVLKHHPMITNGRHDLDAVWPLAGLLLEPLVGQISIDIANPRRAPDLNAKKRQVALGIVGAVIVIMASLLMAGMLHLGTLRKERSSLESRSRNAASGRWQYRRDKLQLEHLQQWSGVEVDWLAHLSQVMELAPGAQGLVLDEFAGSLDFRGVTFDRKNKEWDAPHALRLTVEGEAKDRDTADAFRAALVDEDLYTTASVGADTKGGKRMPFAFNYTLRSATGVPPMPDPDVEAAVAEHVESTEGGAS